MPLTPAEPPRIVDPLTDFAFKRSLGTEETHQHWVAASMVTLAETPDHEWARYRRLLDAWRTTKLIAADRQRDAEHARRLALEVGATQSATGKLESNRRATDAEQRATDALLKSKDAELRLNVAELRAIAADLKAKEAGMSDALARARSAEAAIERLLRELERK